MSNFLSNRDEVKIAFPVGTAVDNVELVSTEYVSGLSKKDSTPWEGIKFTFKRNIGTEVSTLSEIKMLPNEKWARERKDFRTGAVTMTAKQAFNEDVKAYNTYITYIAKTYGVSMDEMDALDGSTFSEIGEKLSSLINASKDNNIKCYLKTCKNKDGYTCLPSYMGTGFIQNMEHGAPNFSYSAKELSLLEAAKSDGVQDAVSDKI